MKTYTLFIALGSLFLLSFGGSDTKKNPFTYRYTVQDLGFADCNEGTNVVQINNRGQILCTNRGGNRVPIQAFLWEKGVRTYLGTLRHPEMLIGTGLNDSGQVVGKNVKYIVFPSEKDDWKAIMASVFWDGKHLQELKDVSPNTYDVSAINNRGQILLNAPNDPKPALLLENNRLTSLGEFGKQGSHATALNDKGQIVGYSILSKEKGYGFHAFLWQDGQMTDLKTLVKEGLPLEKKYLGGSSAKAINNQGGVVGSASVEKADVIRLGGVLVGIAVTEPIETHAFLWQEGKMQDLGTLEDFSLSVALAINDKNQVVGVSAKTWGDHRGMIDPRDWWFDKAFLWENGTLLDLNTLIPAHSGWELGTAFSINNAGQIIGYGIYKQRKHAFLLNPVPSFLLNPVP